MNTIFNCYVYSHSFNGETRYIGKGTGKRAWSHKRSKHWHHLYNLHGQPEVKILAKSLSDEEAFKLEEILIESLGREIDGGRLINISEGKLGAISGNTPWNKGSPWSEEVKDKMRGQRNTKHNKQFKTGNTPHNRGIPMSDDQRYKVKESCSQLWRCGSTGIIKPKHWFGRYRKDLLDSIVKYNVDISTKEN